MKELRKRWSAEQSASMIAALAVGGPFASPFGLTEHGRIDLRGLVIDTPLILKAKVGAPVDLAFATIQKLLLMQCTLDDWSFENATIGLLCNGSDVLRSSFKGSKFKTMSCGGGARFDQCDFSNADLSGTSLNEAQFAQCVFMGAKIRDIEFGTSSFDSVTFSGPIEKAFLRGRFTNCDFSQTAFIDCAIYGATFVGCRFAAHTLLFQDWPTALTRIMGLLPSENLSSGARKAIQTMCGVWSELGGTMPNNIVDLKDLEDAEGGELGQELFRFFERIASS